MSTATGGTQDRPTVDLALLIVRVVVGVIFAAHGAQKLFGAFEGPGLEATVTSMGQMLPKGVVYAVIIGEFFGGCGLVLGFLSRFSAASLILIMAGAIQMVHGPNGFFLQNRGFEYNVALIGLLLPILIAGPGAFSLGRFLMPKSSSTGRPIVVLE